MTRYKIITFWAAIYLCSSCTEIIDLDLKTDPERLVVDALITNENKVQIVRLSKSTPYFEEGDAPPVTGAQVSINYNTATIALRESSEHPGYYYIEPHLLRPQPGTTYQLHITTETDNHGEPNYYTAISTMPFPVTIDSVDMTLQSNMELWQVIAWFRNPPNMDNYYMFSLKKNTSQFTTRPKDWTVTSNRFFKGNYVNGLWVQSISADPERRNLEKGDEITLEINSITEAYHDYLLALQRENTGSNPLFGGPPANSPGNISNGALGFFSTIAVDTLSLIYNPELHN